MKKLNLLLIAILGIFTFASCDKELSPTINSDPGSPSVIAPESGQSYALSEDNADDTLLTMEWTEPDYGFAAATEYSIEMDMEGEDFSDPKEVGNTTESSYSFTVDGLNNRLLSAGLPANISSTVEFRVIANVSDSVKTQVSAPIALGFTPYFVEVEYPEIYVPGSYQSASGYTNDWSPADAPPLYSVNEDDTYEGYVYIANANSEFKFTAERNWDLNWGDDGADGTLQENGENIVASESGYYKINVNLNDMSYETLNTTWGLIGSATADGWDADQDLSYDSEAKVWSLTTDLDAGEVKFRANDEWGLNYGDNEGDGQLDQDGDNIAVDEAGTYTVILDLSSAPYTYSLELN